MVRCRPCDRFGKATAWLVLQAIDRWAGGSGLEEVGTSDAATLERRGEGERLQRAFIREHGRNGGDRRGSRPALCRPHHILQVGDVVKLEAFGEKTAKAN